MTERRSCQGNSPSRWGTWGTWGRGMARPSLPHLSSRPAGDHGTATSPGPGRDRAVSHRRINFTIYRQNCTKPPPHINRGSSGSTVLGLREPPVPNEPPLSSSHIMLQPSCGVRVRSPQLTTDHTMHTHQCSHTGTRVHPHAHTHSHACISGHTYRHTHIPQSRSAWLRAALWWSWLSNASVPHCLPM